MPVTHGAPCQSIYYDPSSILLLGAEGWAALLINFLNGIAGRRHHSHVRYNPWTMFFYGVTATKKPSAAPSHQEDRPRPFLRPQADAVRDGFFEGDAMSTKNPRKCTPAGSNPPLEQLNKRLLQGQIRPFGDKRQYPLLMRFQWRYASSARFRRCASAFVPALQPSDSRTDTDPKAFGRLAPRCPLNLHRFDHAFPQVTR